MSHSYFFFHFSNVAGCGSFSALRWDSESTACEVCVRSSPEVVVNGEFPCDGTAVTSRGGFASKSTADEDDGMLLEACEIDESFSALSSGF